MQRQTAGAGPFSVYGLPLRLWQRNEDQGRRFACSGRTADSAGQPEVVEMTREKATALVQGAMEKLESALREGQSDTLKNFLKAMSRFTRYSLGNVILIASQNPRATHVAGFRAWKDLGRQVRKGEKGIVILAPMRWRGRARRNEESTKQPGTDAGENGNTQDERLLGFKNAYVFDIAQTEGKPLPEFARVQGDPGRFLESLLQFASDRKIRVEFTDDLGKADGASRGGHVRIRESLTLAERFSVLSHELAHELLHHDGQERSRTVKETEAEAVAYVVCEAAGLECSTASSDYIQLYDGKPETLLASLRRIQNTAKVIIDAIGVNERPPTAVIRGTKLGGVEKVAA